MEKNYIIVINTKLKEKEVFIKNISAEEADEIGELFSDNYCYEKGDEIIIYEYVLISKNSAYSCYERKFFKKFEVTESEA